MKESSKLKGRGVSRPITSTSLSIGLVGLPNVGKSNLFNTLTNSDIPSSNFAFCTIDPNIALSYFVTEDFEYLCELFKTQKRSPLILSFKDIAGLIKGSHLGKGLGNKFLANIRESHSILHVVRCFKDEDIIHINNSIEPIEDYKTIREELIFADLKYIFKQYLKFKQTFKNKKKNAVDSEKESVYLKLTKQIIEEDINKFEDEEDLKMINKINEINLESFTEKEMEFLNTLDILSLKNQVICLNVSKKEFEKNKFTQTTAGFVKYIKEKERKEENKKFSMTKFTEGMISKNFLSIIYDSLKLITFYTCGVKEVKAYSVYPGTLITEAAALIHTDFSKYFVSADVYNIADLKEHENEAGVRKAGKVRSKGKTYEVCDGDIVKFNANIPSKKK